MVRSRAQPAPRPRGGGQTDDDSVTPRPSRVRFAGYAALDRLLGVGVGVGGQRIPHTPERGTEVPADPPAAAGLPASLGSLPPSAELGGFLLDPDAAELTIADLE